MPWAGEEVEVYYPWLGDHQMQTPLDGTLAPPPPLPYIESLSSAFICSGESRPLSLGCQQDLKQRSLV